MVFWRKKQNKETATPARTGSSDFVSDQQVSSHRAMVHPTAAKRRDNPAKTSSIGPESTGSLAEAPNRVVIMPSAPHISSVSHMGERRGQSEERRLVVGREIFLDGHIATCDRLIVQGQVEAELTDCRTLEVAEYGTFKGSATVQTAEIWGRFEGELTVRENLLIHGTGRVAGTVRYGHIEVRSGGEIGGDVRSLVITAAVPPKRIAHAPAADENATAMSANFGQH